MYFLTVSNQLLIIIFYLGQSTRHMLCCHRCNFVVEYILCEISFSECKNHLCRFCNRCFNTQYNSNITKIGIIHKRIILHTYKQLKLKKNGLIMHIYFMNKNGNFGFSYLLTLIPYKPRVNQRRKRHKFYFI